ncbi:MAG TPA: SIMPL domain-containing protein [Casimicrobiaceae bacterium]|nr:SIMPL domain-containing protein [Casimicrobiaceae bacterium]
MRHVSAILLLLAWPAIAAAQWGPPPMNQVTLSANAMSEVPSDTVTAVLFVEEQGTDPAEVANRVTAKLQDGFAKAKADPKVEAKSGGYQTYPVYSQQNQITGWRTRAELIVESKDFKAMGVRIEELQRTLKLAQMSFSLSHEARDRVEAQLTTEALARFRDKAKVVATAMGFGGFDLGQISIQNDGGAPPVPIRSGLMLAQRAEAAPVPVEGGKTTVTVTVSGSVVLVPRR